MEFENLVIVRCNVVVPNEELLKIHESLCKMRETGVMVLPSYCDLEFVTAPGITMEEASR